MKILYKIIIIAGGLFLNGCEEVIHVDLDTAPPRMVVDACIDWVKNTPGNEQKIKLTTTTDYYNTEYPIVSGAEVRISNAAGTVFDFIETPGTGEYICTDFQARIGDTYILTINLDGETFTATETFVGVPVMEDTIDQKNDGGFGGDEVEISSYFHDDGNSVDYYAYSFTSNRVAFPQYQVENDEYVQGNRITMYYANKDLVAGDVINIKLYGISERYFDYFDKLLLASGNDGNPFPTTPAEVRGNIVNQTNFDNYAYGYFRLSEVDTQEYVVK